MTLLLLVLLLLLYGMYAEEQAEASPTSLALWPKTQVRRQSISQSVSQPVSALSLFGVHLCSHFHA